MLLQPYLQSLPDTGNDFQQFCQLMKHKATPSRAVAFLAMTQLLLAVSDEFLQQPKASKTEQIYYVRAFEGTQVEPIHDTRNVDRSAEDKILL